uniref:Uncharacterized protein n=1 Tax=Chromera velia CCMP2878 TaxID=1169474 RepID=A0A0G4IC24_9ALVE|eukprot:Cvel_12988.t1-p1 / transcript=Cvel_12988.t1 / gene=Cvel_12988 / organism=Chromera_velia_CCMP2878 / gene_product=hypothetical protein / transcript_product=hypothetical protein / location=Cvel_scaffold871:1277-1663(-) / protein_length=129 / sequence_SO=supercontig / SO=protein_coding / is_pseudo=false
MTVILGEAEAVGAEADVESGRAGLLRVSGCWETGGRKGGTGGKRPRELRAVLSFHGRFCLLDGEPDLSLSLPAGLCPSFSFSAVSLLRVDLTRGELGYLGEAAELPEGLLSAVTICTRRFSSPSSLSFC